MCIKCSFLVEKNILVPYFADFYGCKTHNLATFYTLDKGKRVKR